jgi:cyclic lactone autoinducer peptide
LWAKGGIQMAMKKSVAIIAKAFAEKSLKREANNTSCTIVYQPKAPLSLNNFKKPVRIDK